MLRKVAEWDAGDDTLPVPAVDRATLAALESTLEPAPRALIVREVAELLAMYDPPKASIEVHTKGCVEALLDMPPDILREGLRRLKIERCYPSAPMPGDFRKACQEALSERTRAVVKARVAALRYRPSQPRRREPTEAEKARVAELVAGVVRKARAA